MQNWGERKFLNRQLGMTVYIRIVKIKVQNSKFCHIKNSDC